MTILSSTEDFHKVYDKYKDKFEQNCSPSFHNLLWQFICNGVWSKHVVIFHPVVSKHPDDNFWEIVLVQPEKGGYTPTSVYFHRDIKDYNDACDISDELNEILFGILPKAGCTFIHNSMSLVCDV